MRKSMLLTLLILGLLISSGFGSLTPKAQDEHHLFFLRDKFQVEGEEQIGYWIYADILGSSFSHAPAVGEGVTCIDDVARAGIYYLYQYQNTHDPDYLALTKETIGFTLSLRAPNGDFWNFVLDNGQINRHGITSSASRNWWALRTLWLLSESALVWKDIDPAYAERLFSLAITTARLFTGEMDQAGLIRGYTDMSGVYLIGLCNLRESELGHQTFLETQIHHVAQGLMSKQIDESPWTGLIDEGRERFHWNGWGTRQVQGLARAYEITGTEEYLIAAQKMANHFYPLLLATGPVYSISNLVFQEYSQIAYAAEAMITSLFHLYRITQMEKYAQMASIAHGFFHGNNPLNRPMVRPNGAGLDGLERIFINQNAGAESTISYLLARALIDRLPDEIIALSRAQQILSSGILSIYAHQMDPGLSMMEIARVDGEEGLFSRNLRLRHTWTPKASDYQVMATGRFLESIDGNAIFEGISVEKVPSAQSGWIGNFHVTPFHQGRLTLSLRSSQDFFVNQLLLIPMVPYQILDLDGVTFLWAANRADTTKTLVLEGCRITLDPGVFLLQPLDQACLPEIGQKKSQDETQLEISVREEGDYFLLELSNAVHVKGFGIPREPGNFDNYGAPSGAYYPLEELLPLLDNGLLHLDHPFLITLGPQADHLILTGQRWTLPKIQASTMVILGSSDHGDYQALFELGYVDGSKETIQVGFSDWCGQPVFGEEIGITFPFRYLASHQKEWIRPKLYIQTIPLKDTPLLSVSMPVLKTMHIVAVTLF